METDAYQHQLSVQPEPTIAPTNSSYMDQKREELQRYMAQKQNATGAGAPPGYQHSQPQSYEEEQTREAMKQQMERELAEEMERMRVEDYKRSNEQENQAPAETYGKQYQQPPTSDYNAPESAQNSYQTQIRPLDENNSGPSSNYGAGGRSSIAADAAANKKLNQGGSIFNNGGMNDSTYQTTSSQYGDRKSRPNSKAQNAIHGKMTVNDDKGFNVITGQFSG